ncbi:Na+/H+ antiporter NhaA [Actinomadura madurae]|uniref:Na+/H+ antiporter NhaA n=1 Tax=Actinomadura madurae TaxID=1993 RepID=UPI0020D25E4C|nr:Na+/H+ antiporter NhaA [Actinomadura madurae]MCP9949814.1 Na+/H+ antiporter NhaA [Actinomadura madurae]MCP9979056.1 Na+/H+ antiporter NhaA [Actinomadura madurae]MCQ0009417.1 Na+/H+ antiporter NhaA [Actinomadura madurae]
MTERSFAVRALPEGLRAFLATETGSTSVLLAGTLAGLVWANLPLGYSYDEFWHTDLAVTLGEHGFSLTLREWVNDGLMTLFFFVIGLEVSRELRLGQLRDRRLIAVPAVAALGGVILPAVVYIALNAGGSGASGWGIPIASDTAFVLGLLAVIGTRCPEPLRAFLLTLAVVDDVAAILVVAVFYTEDLSLLALAAAVVLVGLIVALRWLRIWRAPAYTLLGVGVWAAMLASGVHPTLAGLLLGVLVAVYAPTEYKLLAASEIVQALSRDPSPALATEALRTVRRTVSVNERLQLRMHPYTSYVIVPIFALANAGVVLDGEALRAAATSPVTLGIVAGLVLGKFAGIAAGAWLPLRLNWGDLPGNLVWGQLLGGAAVSGIGFTVSLFVTELAFSGEPALQSDAKIGIIAGSLLAAACGWLIFRLAWNRGAVCAPPGTAPPEPDFVPEPPPPVTSRDHVLGPADAPVTLIEYGDFECPYCGRAKDAIRATREHWGDRLRFVFRHFPLREVHPHAVSTAVVSESAADAGRFWEMHDILFDNQLALTDADLTEYGDRLGLQVWTDLDRHRERVQSDRDKGERAGVSGTPTFFINGTLYDGPYDTDSLIAAIATALNEPPAP